MDWMMNAAGSISDWFGGGGEVAHKAPHLAFGEMGGPASAAPPLALGEVQPDARSLSAALGYYAD